MWLNNFCPTTPNTPATSAVLSGTFLLLLLLLQTSFGEAADSHRKKWVDSRPVAVLKDSGISGLDTNTEFFPNYAEVKANDPCPPTEPPIPGMLDIKDGAIQKTVAIHYYKIDPSKADGKEYKSVVVSDLTEARKCDAATSKVACLEKDAMEEDHEGRKICVKKGKVDKGKECIHHIECPDGLLCLYNAGDKMNGIEGDIEDPRRFCSGGERIVGNNGIALLAAVISIVSTVFII